jgi:glutamyl/glutaminyl-tRNA synthetase
MTGGHIVLRMEDHDLMRCRIEWMELFLEDMVWLGLEPAEGLLQCGKLADANIQSKCSKRYSDFVEILGKKTGGLYECSCTRKQIRGAQIVEHGEVRYSGLCRLKKLNQADNTSLRLALPDSEVQWSNGAQIFTGNPWLEVGDPVLRDRHGQFTYLTCVVADDLYHDIDVVIRGADLVSSTSRQVMLMQIADAPKIPYYIHHPLLMDATGKKLSKTRGSRGISTYRDAGVSKQVLMGELLAYFKDRQWKVFREILKVGANGGLAT